MISIIIPNFNGRELLEKNLPFLIEAKRNKKNDIGEIIVVDDASNDESVNFLKKNYGRNIKLVVHKINRGFAASVNTGARTATGQFICLVNSDVVVSRDFLSSIRKDFKNQNVFAVSLHEKGFGPAKGKFEKGFIAHEGLKEPAFSKAYDEARESFWASGGSAVFRRNIWMELGGMDHELMPFYFEDIDLSYRAQKRGYKVLWDPLSYVIHNHESTYKKLNQGYVSRMRERNYLLFNWKNLTSKNYIRKHIVALLKKIIRHPGYLIIFLMAISKLNIVIKRRKIEMKEAIVSDEAIFAKFN